MKARIISTGKIVDLYATVQHNQLLHTDGEFFYSTSQYQILEPDWDEFRREAAAKILGGLAANPDWNISSRTSEQIAEKALSITDALIAKLNKKEESDS